MKLLLDDAELRPLVATIVAETLAHLDTAGRRLDGERLGYPEREAAGLLGVPRHVLRDARLRGDVKARRVGRGFIYGRDSLLAWLAGGNQ